MTDKPKSTDTSKPMIAPKIEAIPKKWDWKETGLDTFFLFAISTFELGLNSFGEQKHIFTVWQVNPNNNKVMGEQQYYFESNSKTVKKIYLDYFQEWKEQMVGTRVWIHMSSNQQEGLYIVKAE
jgi:hypothetical protein